MFFVQKNAFASANPDSKDGEKKDDDVIDADFEEVDEDKSADSK